MAQRIRHGLRTHAQFLAATKSTCDPALRVSF
jgi:hypothetical protein